MWPLGFFGSLVAGRLLQYSRRICGQAALLGSAKLLHQPRRNLGDRVSRFGFDDSAVAMGALSLSMGGLLYFNKENAEEPLARKLIHQEELLEEETIEEKAMKKRFEQWMVENDRTYKGKEKAMRYEIFKREAELVDEHNARPGQSTTWGTNDFSDRTDEFRSGCGCSCRVWDEEVDDTESLTITKRHLPDAW
ncbi:uncharacterized protein LOC100843827 isoform X2 [Brachypodium distachyon]|uniref:Cathepsin propeptide inhibitor domain-containing protein n=1 Tax=Brachypodium distachyon TaxID=15368 RepID=A0A2K2DMA9_BRADI|nr:uncharacterized protein LOC100843827 isoform X2 [Brachypodium distachyon]PNT75417.1 hypothetical protein BRADI_1g32287v3 [Brachypodium distachyon]|eukprot:XP_010240561.1 uncharacterized protein LOC100843827 isoform X2 [Brachypodium distachyon]